MVGGKVGNAIVPACDPRQSSRCGGDGLRHRVAAPHYSSSCSACQFPRKD
jgi:hypothetical protein